MGEQVASTIDVKAETRSQSASWSSSKAGSRSLGAGPASRSIRGPSTVSGILKTGVKTACVCPPDMDALTGTSGTVSLKPSTRSPWKANSSAPPDAMNAGTPDIHAQTVRRLAQSDAGVLTMLRSLPSSSPSWR